MTTDALLALARLAHTSEDPVLVGRCLETANGRQERTFRRVIKALCPGNALTPVPWLREAQRVAKSIVKTTNGRHHLYVILLDGFQNGGRYGVYVGESRYRPENRFRQHKAGENAAGSVERMGVCLLPSLYEHLNPLSRQEARQLEPVLAEAFRLSGITVRGGH